MKVLGVIPARGGSKGLPRKNVLPLGGKPLIAWSIEAARGATLLSRTVVSTDDSEIAAVARAAGGEVPFLRPSELATDGAASMPVVRHAMLECEKIFGERYDAVCLMQPTCPFRSPADIDAAIKLLGTGNTPSVVSVCPAEHPPQWTVFVDQRGRVSFPLLDENGPGQRQKYARACRLNGVVYVYQRAMVESHPTGLTPETVAYLMDGGAPTPIGVLTTARSLDIDTLEDLELCRALVAYKSQQK